MASPFPQKRKKRAQGATVIHSTDETVDARKGLPSRVVAAIREAASRGIAVETISIQLDIPPSKVQAIIDREKRKLKPERDSVRPLTVLRAEADRVLKLIPIAETEYVQEPNVDNARALATLIGEARALIQQAERSKEPRDEFREVAEDIIQPMVAAFIQAATRMLAELKSSTTQNLPANHKNRIGQEFVKKMQEISEHMKMQYDSAVEKLADIYGIDLHDENTEEKNKKKLKGFRDS